MRPMSVSAVDVGKMSLSPFMQEGDSTEIFAYIEEDVRLAVYTAYFFACPKGAPDTICRVSQSLHPNDDSMDFTLLLHIYIYRRIFRLGV